MNARLLLLLLAAVTATAFAQAPRAPLKPLPRGAIHVPGATPGASDATTALPEGIAVSAQSIDSRYFGMTYAVPAGWTQKVLGPPPSDSGTYVLALLVPSAKPGNEAKGSILIQAQDLFFSTAPVSNSAELVSYARKNLPPSQQVQREPWDVKLGAYTFTRLDYGSADVGLYWRVAATEIRCHAVQFVFTGPDPATLDRMVTGLEHLAPRNTNAPLCVANYAVPANIVERVEPRFPAHRFNAIPVRLIIDRKGRVKHVHVISAFPEQSAALTEALMKWRFKPYRKDGKPVEIETGILFGRAAPATRALR